jgi:hypothetical protein
VSGLFAALLRVHLSFAAFSTLAFWLAACSPKGGRFHRAVGRWFERMIYATALSGGILAIAQLVAPAVVRPPDPSWSAETIATHVSLTRQTMWLVLYVLVTIVAPVQHGLATVAAGAQPMRLRSRAHAIWNLLAMAGSVLLIPAAVAWQQWLYLIVAPAGFIIGVRNLNYAGQPFATPAGWRREHLTSMLAAGIMLHTVMFVFASSRTLALTLSGWVALAPWTVPALVGLPIIIWLRTGSDRGQTQV